MKAKTIAKSANARKAKNAPESVDEYFSSVPEPARAMLAKIRRIIRSTLPAGSLEVISYSMPAFKLNKVLVWYAAFQDHCSLFPTAVVMERLRPDLAGYKISKGTVQFPLDKPLPSALIRKILKARLKMIG